MTLYPATLSVTQHETVGLMCTQNVITSLEFEAYKNKFQTKQSLLMKHFAVVKQTMDYLFTEVV